MRLFWRIFTTVVVTLCVIFVALEWLVPIALSFYAEKEALPIARVVPVELQDHSISLAAVRRLSYFGYEFEIPWNDLDDSQTKLYPKDKPPFRADLHFRSALRLIVSAIPAGSWIDELSDDLKAPKQRVALSFGGSDYDVEKTIFEFTPDHMHYWSLSPRVHYREQELLIIKSLVPTKSAETGVFNVGNQVFRGFQEGNPKQRPLGIYVHLFDKDGSIELILVQKDYKSPGGITQPEINRVIESLHRSPVGNATIAEAKNH